MSRIVEFIEKVEKRMNGVPTLNMHIFKRVAEEIYKEELRMKGIVNRPAFDLKVFKIGTPIRVKNVSNALDKNIKVGDVENCLVVNSIFSNIYLAHAYGNRVIQSDISIDDIYKYEITFLVPEGEIKKEEFDWSKGGHP